MSVLLSAALKGVEVPRPRRKAGLNGGRGGVRRGNGGGERGALEGEEDEEEEGEEEEGEDAEEEEEEEREEREERRREALAAAFEAAQRCAFPPHFSPGCLRPQIFHSTLPSSAMPSPSCPIRPCDAAISAASAAAERLKGDTAAALRHVRASPHTLRVDGKGRGSLAHGFS